MDNDTGRDMVVDAMAAARKAKELPPKGPTRGAADIAFQNDFGPVVAPDGGFTDPREKE